MRSAFVKGADADAKMTAVQKLRRDARPKFNAVLKLRLKEAREMRITLNKSKRGQRKSWKNLVHTLKSQVRKMKAKGKCPCNKRAANKSEKKNLRILQSIQKPSVPTKWCDTQKAGSAEKKFCDSWSKYSAAQEKKLFYKSQWHTKVMNLHFAPLKACAAAMEKDVRDLKGARAIIKSTKECMRNVRRNKKNKEALKAIWKSLRTSRNYARKFWKLFRHSFKVLKKGPKPPTRGINIVKIIGMDYKRAVKFVKENVVLGQTDKRVESIRAVKIDGKPQAVTKDLRRDRVNVEVLKRKITKIVGQY